MTGPGFPVEITAMERETPSADGQVDSRAAAGPPGRKLEELPRDVGVVLVSVGALGLVLPGMMGAPMFVAGGLLLWPRSFRGLENWLRRSNPALYDQGMKQISRYLDDLERRYPYPTDRSSR
jgi:hypothetical protein